LRYLILAIAALALAPLPAIAAEVLILQGSTSPALEQVTRLVQNDCANRNRTLVLSDYAEVDVQRMVREERPSVVVAIGDHALSAARKIRSVPVIYAMALGAETERVGRNVTGVSMMVSPSSYLQLFHRMKLNRVGVLYDQKRSGAYLQRAREAAGGSGVELIDMQVSSPREVTDRLKDLFKRGIDAIWMIPDTTAITAENLESYFNFAQRSNLPVIGFSSAYLSKGALASIELTRQDIGKNLCIMINGVKNGEQSESIDPPSGRVRFNDAVARRLGIRIPLISGAIDKRENDA